MASFVGGLVALLSDHSKIDRSKIVYGLAIPDTVPHPTHRGVPQSGTMSPAGPTPLSSFSYFSALFSFPGQTQPDRVEDQLVILVR